MSCKRIRISEAVAGLWILAMLVPPSAYAQQHRVNLSVGAVLLGAEPQSSRAAEQQSRDAGRRIVEKGRLDRRNATRVAGARFRVEEGTGSGAWSLEPFPLPVHQPRTANCEPSFRGSLKFLGGQEF